MSDQSMTAQPLARSILAELQEIKLEMKILREFADLLGRANGSDESFMATVSHLLGLLVAGMEANQQSLKNLHVLIREPAVSRVLRQAIHDD